MERKKYGINVIEHVWQYHSLTVGLIWHLRNLFFGFWQKRIYSTCCICLQTMLDINKPMWLMWNESSSMRCACTWKKETNCYAWWWRGEILNAMFCGFVRCLTQKKGIFNESECSMRVQCIFISSSNNRIKNLWSKHYSNKFLNMNILTQKPPIEYWVIFSSSNEGIGKKEEKNSIYLNWCRILNK